MALYFDGASSSHAPRVSKQLTTNWGPIGAVTPELAGNVSPYVESYEIKGHLVIQETQRALNLVRLSWGWYLQNPAGSESTMIEAYNADGSFHYTANNGYDAAGSYPSHAHAWSTGPADALISHIVGLRITGPGGREWILAPQFGDLDRAEGGFTTMLGRFSASWRAFAFGYVVEYEVPEGTRGFLLLPSNPGSKIHWHGRQRARGRYDTSRGVTEVPALAGKHKLTVTHDE